MTNAPLGVRVGWWAHALMAMARRGLHFSQDPHDRLNYEHLVGIAAEMRAAVDEQPAAEVEAWMRQPGAPGGPLPVVDAAVFDSQGRILLIQRSDSGEWALPGGGLDVGETPAEGACRETLEETGLTARMTHLIGVYDSRRWQPDKSWHLYAFLFMGEPVAGEARPTHEALAVGWFTADNLPNLAPWHALRVADAIQYYQGPHHTSYFDL